MKYDKITMEEILNGFNILKRKNRKRKEAGSYKSKVITFDEWLIKEEKGERVEDIKDEKLSEND